MHTLLPQFTKQLRDVGRERHVLTKRAPFASTSFLPTKQPMEEPGILCEHCSVSSCSCRSVVSCPSVSLQYQAPGCPRCASWSCGTGRLRLGPAAPPVGPAARPESASAALHP